MKTNITSTYTSKEKRETSNYILRILRGSGNVFFSWGAQALRYGEIDNKIFLRFKSNGFKHRGHVYVFYNSGKDLFEVVLSTIRGRELKRVEDLYIEDLTSVIDMLIERGGFTESEYSNKVNKFINDVIFQ